MEAIRLRFYGFYLISCEDIGMKPQLLGRAGRPKAAKTAALEWLKDLEQNPDLACDTRVAVPIYVDRYRRQDAALGDAGRAPGAAGGRLRPAAQVRPQEQGGPWKEVEATSSPRRST